MNTRQTHIAYLWQQFADKKATPAEIDALFEYLNDPSADETSLRFLQQQFAESVSAEKLDKEYWMNKLNDILKAAPVAPLPAGRQGSGQQAAVHRVHLLRRSWFRYAAVAVLIFGIAILAVVVSSDRQSATSETGLAKKVIPNDVLPGSERAILTLANGKTIMLDSMQGNIIRQGGLTVSNGNGQLDYEGRGDVVEYHTMSTPRGGQYRLQLPDGTDVWLNAASSITYPTAFAGKDRHVTITGEVYFEVAKDTTKPFHAKVNNMEVEVLGTHFNINSYADEGNIKTTLFEGSVRVIQGNDAAMLEPGQQAQINMTAVALSSGRPLNIVNGVDADQVMAWKNGLFQFDKTSLSAVMRQLSRWYDVDVVYEKGVPDINLGGEMKRDLKLSQVLKGLGKIGVNFRIEGGKRLVVLP